MIILGLRQELFVLVLTSLESKLVFQTFFFVQNVSNTEMHLLGFAESLYIVRTYSDYLTIVQSLTFRKYVHSDHYTRDGSDKHRVWLMPCPCLHPPLPSHS